MDKTVLAIKTDMMLSQEVLNKLREQFIEQVEQGVVIIPAWFEAEVIQVPENVEIRVEAEMKGE